MEQLWKHKRLQVRAAALVPQKWHEVTCKTNSIFPITLTPESFLKHVSFMDVRPRLLVQDLFAQRWFWLVWHRPSLPKESSMRHFAPTPWWIEFWTRCRKWLCAYFGPLNLGNGARATWEYCLKLKHFVLRRLFFIFLQLWHQSRFQRSPQWFSYVIKFIQFSYHSIIQVCSNMSSFCFVHIRVRIAMAGDWVPP